MPTYYIPIIAMFVVLFVILRSRRRAVAREVIKKIYMEDKTNMIELAKKFVGKECLIYSFDNNQIEGVIREVSDGALLIEKNGEPEAINLNFVIRIREYPKNKNGKKKSVVLD